MKKTTLLLLSLALIAVTTLVTQAIRHDWLFTTVDDILEDYGDDLAFFMDERPMPAICYVRIDGWKHVDQVPCAVAVPRLHPQLGWIARNKIFYFQDAWTGLCVASGIIHGATFYAVLDDCSAVEHLLGPADKGRYRLDVRLE